MTSVPERNAIYPIIYVVRSGKLDRIPVAVCVSWSYMYAFFALVIPFEPWTPWFGSGARPAGVDENPLDLCTYLYKRKMNITAIRSDSCRAMSETSH